jgi:uncharacterized membrane protein YhhN
MEKKYSSTRQIVLLLFIIDCILELLFIDFFPDFRVYTKSLLMPLLACYMLTFDLQSSQRNIGLFTLLFAWLGDVFLLIPSNSALYFQLGLGSFLIMQIAYIRQFVHLGAWKYSHVLFPVLAYVIGFIGFLVPYLPPALIPPVVLYALALGSMLYFAIQIPSVQLRLGAFLFVVSDSLLAFGKFYFEYPWNSLAVMSTYILAQLLLIYALCKLHTQGKS